MKKRFRLRQFGLACSLVVTALHQPALAQSNPTPHVLTTGAFRFNEWAADAPAGTYPASMVFHYINNPTAAGFNQFAPATADYVCGYDLTEFNRLNGLGTDGISFTGSGSEQPDCSGSNAGPRFVGAAVVSLNTLGFTQTIAAQWEAATIGPVGEGAFLVQPQYRIGTSGAFAAIDGATTYESESGSASTVLQFDLPEVCQNKAVVQIRWVYFQNSSRPVGTARPTIRLDNILISSATDVTLPVELAHFRPQLNEDQTVTLHWRTVQERNSREFILERSVNAVEFAAVGRLAAAGTVRTPRQYSFTDRAPLAGVNYYRLRQVDLDGRQYLYRPVAIVTGTDRGPQAYPNPSDGTLFTVRALAGFGDRVQLVDLSRRTLGIQTTRLNDLEVQVRPTQRLTAGVYLLGVPAEDGRTRWQRLMVR
jgi:hypothetical protein